MSLPRSVLVVDDEPYVRDSIRSLLQGEGWRVHVAEGAHAAVALLAERPVHVIVSDLRMPDGDVFTLLQALSAETAPIPVIVITGVGTVSEAVRAMKAGAYDFLQKPVDPEELLLLTQRAADHRALLREVEDLRETTRRLRAPRGLVGSSEPMRLLRERIAQVAPADTPVLITGESGTGKELAAEEIHAASARAERPLRRVPCAAQGASGAPGDEAGTLLFDDIGALPLEEQARLAQALTEQDAAARPRVIAIAGSDLEAAVAAGAFRSDLFWRLNVFHLALPPLREHREDIPELVEHFLAWARGQGSGRGLSQGLAAPEPAALEVLAAYGWPGNVRELRNVLERAVIVAQGRPLGVEVLRDVLEPALSAPLSDDSKRDLHLRTQLDAAEKELVQRALVRADGLKKQAAYWLGIDPRNLGYYLRKHGL